MPRKGVELHKIRELLSKHDNLDIYDKYFEIYNKIITESDVSHVPFKYISDIGLLDKLWDNYTVLTHARKRGLRNGVDIGCAIASSSVVGSLLEMNVIGIDIDQYDLGDSMPISALNIYNTTERKFELPYMSMINNLRKKNLNIDVFNTNSYPWEQYADDRFDFVIGCWALAKNFVTKGESLDSLNETKENRIKELIRISKVNSTWYICPNTHIENLFKYESFRTNNKNIKVYNSKLKMRKYA